MYFSREFNLETTVQISSQSVKICSSYAASQFEKYSFENAFKVLSDYLRYYFLFISGNLLFILTQLFLLHIAILLN